MIFMVTNQKGRFRAVCLTFNVHDQWNTRSPSSDASESDDLSRLHITHIDIVTVIMTLRHTDNDWPNRSYMIPAPPIALTVATQPVISCREKREIDRFLPEPRNRGKVQ